MISYPISKKPSVKNNSQKNLHSFFKITQPQNPKHKKCFIYDPEKKCASFEYSPDDTDIFIIEKLTIKLYYRPPIEISNAPVHPAPGADQDEIFKANTSVSIPLLKSNLQKAIRRGHNNIAIQSAIQLIYLDKMQFLRRLPIIYVEDVCLMDSFPMVIWLMMADKYYTLTHLDINILLHCINGLCDCKKAVGYMENSVSTKYTHEYLENLDNHTQLLSLYYRSLYGGMGRDMHMLEDAIGYYIAHPQNIERTNYGSIDFCEICNMHIEILVEAIDFHPFPYMLSILEKKTRLDKMVIREYIWNVESGYNIRKSLTIRNSNKYKANPQWHIISQYLEEVRDLLLVSLF
jgi:hypothetical protein